MEDFMYYKYMQKKYALEFLRTGSLRIGTLFDFKNTEKHNEAIGDITEGLHTQFIEKYNTNSQELTQEELDFLRPAIKFDNTKCQLDSFRLIKDIQVPDAYVFCISQEYSKKIMDSFECDVCIEISNLKQFLSQIDRKLRHFVKPMSWAGPITYMERHYPFHEEKNIYPATTKEPKYSYQKEFRVIWDPLIASSQLKPLKPKIIKIPNATRFCRLI